MWSVRAIVRFHISPLIQLIVIGAVVLVISCESRATNEKENLGYRIRNLNLHIDHVDGKIKKLEEAVRRLGLPMDKFSLYSSWMRVQNLEATKPCGENEVVCGGERPDCIHHLFVCDGIRDCWNGRDEDLVICSENAITPGSSFRGLVHWIRCATTKDHYVTITILTTSRVPYFGSRSAVSAMITIEPANENSEHTDPFIANGFFVYASRQLVLSGRRSDGGGSIIVSICNFDRGNNDQANCRIIMESTHETCAVFKVERVY